LLLAPAGPLASATVSWSLATAASLTVPVHTPFTHTPLYAALPEVEAIVAGPVYVDTVTSFASCAVMITLKAVFAGSGETIVEKVK
jgi:hypothetical protein